MDLHFLTTFSKGLAIQAGAVPAPEAPEPPPRLASQKRVRFHFLVIFGAFLGCFGALTFGEQEWAQALDPAPRAF